MKRAPAKVSLESSTATQGQFRVLIFIPVLSETIKLGANKPGNCGRLASVPNN